MARQELIGVGEARIKRHGEHGPTAGLAHLEAEALRSRAAAEHHGDSKPSNLDLDGLSTPEIEPLQHATLPLHRTLRATRI
jgi:hypothetical protein